MCVKKFTSFCRALKDAHKRKLVDFFSASRCMCVKRQHIALIVARLAVIQEQISWRTIMSKCNLSQIACWNWKIRTPSVICEGMTSRETWKKMTIIFSFSFFLFFSTFVVNKLIHNRYKHAAHSRSVDISSSQLPPSLQSTTHQSLQFWFTQSYEWHFLHRFHGLTTPIIHHPIHSFIPGFKPSFSANPHRHRSLPFFLQDWLHEFPGLVTDTSKHIRFYVVQDKNLEDLEQR